MPKKKQTSSDEEQQNEEQQIETKNPPVEKKSSAEMFRIIDWYNLNIETLGPQDLDMIIQNRGKLATYAVEYAKVILRYAKDYGKFHVQRSINVKVRANELQAMQDPDAANNKTYTNARANEMATIENKEIYEQEYLAEANYNGHRLILNQINHVLDAMKQDIAEFRSIRGDNDKTEGDVR